MGQHTDKLYRDLQMPVDGRDAIEIGTFQPADTPQIVEDFAATRLRQLVEARGHIDQIDPSLTSEIPLFHTYDDFLKDLKLTETNRSDLTDRWRQDGVAHVDRRPLEHGHSLGRHTSDHAGYMAYLATAEPELHGFLRASKPARIAQEALRRHTHIIGQTGSGKSELLKSLIAAQLRSPLQPTLVLIDPKGDFAKEVAMWPDVQDRLVYIDPELDPTHRLQPTLNPLHIDDQSPEAIDRTAVQVKNQMAELLGTDAALSTSMEAMLLPCLALMLSRPGSTLEDLMMLLGLSLIHI